MKNTHIATKVNGDSVEFTCEPDETLLEVLRNRLGLTGTKEGCGTGDCGACSVLVNGRLVCSCLVLAVETQGAEVSTIEGMASGDGLHILQQTFIDHAALQCGICTPGILVAAKALLDKNPSPTESELRFWLAGNLCRCTGYAPIIRAAVAAQSAPVPPHMHADHGLLAQLHTEKAVEAAYDRRYYHPTSLDDFANWYFENPKATLIAGATDVGLWVTKGLRDLPQIAFLGKLKALQSLELTDDHISVGAGVTIAQLKDAIGDIYPSFGQLLSRYGSHQVRQAATLGGNIANGSPIGDAPPVLIALGARLHLRQGQRRRVLNLEDYFLEYGRQDRLVGEFVEKITWPRAAQNLRCYKVSKRRDQDISALCGAFNLEVNAQGLVTAGRIAFGGMSGTPKRARFVETALVGHPWTAQTVEKAAQAFTQDFTPLSDLRASSAYRETTAHNLLVRYFNDLAGKSIDISEVTL